MDEMNVTGGGKAKALAAAAGFAAAIPFVISNVQTSSRSVNGHIVELKYRDWVAVGSGGFALAVGLIASVIAIRSKASTGITAACLIVTALGGYHVARGFGVFEAKPEPESHMSADLALPMPPAPV